MIRKTREEDLDAVMQIVQDAQAYLHAHDIPQWINGYPSRDDFHHDMERGSSYVLEESGTVLGMACISTDHEDTYDVIDGAWPDDDPYIVIHRIAVADACKGRNLAHQFVEYAENLGRSSIRIDTHEKNTSMRAFLEKEGFAYCGIIHLHDGAPRYAYEKQIRQK